MVIVSSPSPISAVVYPTGEYERSVSPGPSTSISPSVSPTPELANNLETNVNIGSLTASSSPSLTTTSLVTVAQNVAEISSKELFANDSKKTQELNALEVAELIDELITSKSNDDNFVNSLKSELTANSAKKLWNSNVDDLNKISRLLSNSFDKDFHRGLYTILVTKAKSEK